ncbi:hypothetical protein JCM10908_002917 [Rhodotorula pacifica]|uniref:uncharacterized protein n=1 Tax=Rhodotorula pacifica TaxID=1495444 RepID=UPI00317DD0D3
MKISHAFLFSALACSAAYAAPVVEAETQENSVKADQYGYGDGDDYGGGGYYPGWRCYGWGWRRRCWRCYHGRCYGGGYGDGYGGGYGPPLTKRDAVASTAADDEGKVATEAAAEPVEIVEEPLEAEDVEAYRRGYGYGGGYGGGWGYGGRYGGRYGGGYGGGYRHGWHGGYGGGFGRGW